ncbi:5-formyltetrahydrofolate cyclo-ligase [Novosphingobium sp. 1949]|uniref:5-formyltetrahydrofolate cyclo-ligase n=1 Tax=Novosphingobium organovorum TaxID=2930092 RepID=A0ABT0B9A0_9SPHN|nr:5-formyltetrahydrofolate cyclo-ligase [Novosphingobium organovorum]MCJ2181631.1 5-formyltetrahydrofolate cyclo-ligase [Novosphingobium organovorum]
MIDRKALLRKDFRQARAEHVEALPATMRALILNRPPAPVTRLMPKGATIGLYYPLGPEAPSLGWARWLAENGRTVALPHFSSRSAPMEFRVWSNPFDESQLSPGPYRMPQPAASAPFAAPEVVIVPLIAFTEAGHRLGQGGGHYDRWLAAHPGTRAIGLAWDCQLAEDLPIESHDQPLSAVVTPTRFYHPQD